MHTSCIVIITPKAVECHCGLKNILKGVFHLFPVIPFPPLSIFSSSSINKHWEAELAALKGNNAKLTAALLESTANVKQWKQQLAAYQEEAERLHKRVSLCPCTQESTHCVIPFYHV